MGLIHQTRASIYYYLNSRHLMVVDIFGLRSLPDCFEPNNKTWFTVSTWKKLSITSYSSISLDGKKMQLDVVNKPYLSHNYKKLQCLTLSHGPTDQAFNLEFQFKSVFKLEFQPEFGIQLRIPIPMGIDLGECTVCLSFEMWIIFPHFWSSIESRQTESDAYT